MCPLCSSCTDASTVCSYLSLYQQWNSIPSSFSFPPIQIRPVVFWKGGYIHCYCMISQNLSSQPLKRGRADRSWEIPAVSPGLGKTWVSLTIRTLPFLSNPFRFFLLLCATETILCQLNRFFRAHLRHRQGRLPVQVDLGVFVLVEAFENKQEDRRA